MPELLKQGSEKIEFALAASHTSRECTEGGIIQQIQWPGDGGEAEVYGKRKILQARAPKAHTKDSAKKRKKKRTPGTHVHTKIKNEKVPPPEHPNPYLVS